MMAQSLLPFTPSLGSPLLPVRGSCSLVKALARHHVLVNLQALVHLETNGCTGHAAGAGTRHTCLAYFLLRRASYSAKPSKFLSWAALMGLACSAKLASLTHPLSTTAGTVDTLQIASVESNVSSKATDTLASAQSQSLKSQTCSCSGSAVEAL